MKQDMTTVISKNKRWPGREHSGRRNSLKDKKYNKLNKGVWGMPRLSEAMKDVISCENLRGSAHTM